MRQKNNSASAEPNSHDNNGNNDDDFPDIDEVLSGTKQKSVPASAKPNHSSMARKVDNGTRGDSPLDSSRSTKGSTQDPIILNDDESIGAEFETDCTDPDVDLVTNNCLDFSHAANSEPADGIGSRTALISQYLVTDYQDDNDNNSNATDTQLRLFANRSRSASLIHKPVTHRASKQLNTDITQGSTNLNVTKESKQKGFNVSETSDKDGDSTTKKQELFAVSDKNLVFDSNIPQ